MLGLTNSGFRRSVKEHNCNDEIVSDWVLINALLCDDGEISKSDVIDTLFEQGIYDDSDPDYCSEYVNSIWAIIRAQLELLGDSSPLLISERVISRKNDWHDAPVFTFFVVLFLKKFLEGWSDKFGNDHTDQGEFFEKICALSIKEQFSDFNIMITGWSKNEATNFSEVANNVAKFVSEQTRPKEIARYTNQNTKELGLDIIWTNSFQDGRGGNVNFLAQCASGHNFESKLKTPDLSLWREVIRWTSPPSKAFMVPFAISESEFPGFSVRSEGNFFDRYRILISGKEESRWLDGDLMGSIIEWLAPRIEWIKENTL